MSTPRPMFKPDKELLARIRADSERRLTAEEVRERLAIPISDQERAETVALIRWFCRRYPTPGERLAAARRLYRQWATSMPGD